MRVIRSKEFTATRAWGADDIANMALFLAGLPGPAAQLGLGTVVAAAQLGQHHRRPGLAGRVDRNRIAVAGHSWGAQTAGMLLGVAVRLLAVLWLLGSDGVPADRTCGHAGRP